MSGWLNQVTSGVGGLLDKLDDQVENVRDVLTEQRDSDSDDEDEYDSDSEEESGDEEEGGEEEEIDLMEEEPKAALFSPQAEEAAFVDPTVKLPQDSTPAPQQAPQGSQQPPPAAPQQPVAPKAVPPAVPKAPAKLQASNAVSAQKPPAHKPVLATQSKKAPPPTPPGAVKPTPPAKSAPPSSGSAKGPPTKPGPPSHGKSGPPSRKGPPPPPHSKGPPPQKAQPPPPPKGAPGSKGVNPNNKQAVLAEMDRLRKQVASLQQELTLSNKEVNSQQKENASSKQQLLAEMKPMRKQIVSLQQELTAANKEIKAQQKELNSAATIVERERQDLKEEKEDMQEDHEEEIDNLKADYQDKIDNLKAQHKQQLEDMRLKLTQEKAERQQEGGDLSQDLEEALQRERDALQELGNLREEKSSLESKVEKLTSEQESLEEKLETALQAQTAATQRQQQAETVLDDALEQHKRQLKQRQVREAELERTIAEMGTALTTSSSAATNNGTGVMGASAPAQNDEKATYYKEQWELATEEVETLKGKLKLETQRGEALRRELDEINQERTQEATSNQDRQRHYDRKLEEQSSTISRLESTVRDLQPEQDGGASDGTQSEQGAGGATLQRLQRQLEESQQQVKRLSEQLLRQQGMADVHKSEILALKGRLQAANARAEEAEKTAFQSTADNGRMYESEGSGVGHSGYKIRRRVKGRGGVGSAGGRSVTVRSIRTALNMGPGSSMEGLGKTIEALDSWMIDTGAILRMEPLARLGFFLYFSILHLWCFCLVAFHVSESSSAGGRAGQDFPSSLRGGSAVNAASGG